MAVQVPQGWYDISVPLNQEIVYNPLDPFPPKIYRLKDAALGSVATMSMIEIISHTGTHVDAPIHFIPGGSTISDMPLEATIGPARVIEIKDPEKITVEELKLHNIKKGERILCKTRNSPRAYEGPGWMEDFVYLDLAAAKYLAEVGIVLFGLDDISVGSTKEFEVLRDTHTALLGKGVYVLEDCALGGVPPGEYELLCLPLLMYGGDAGPCRAILRPLR
jgi:arylformamidase